ncbi:MAG: branched-chain-amino-acid transaminase [Nitrospinae bacterium]|nr:branched-chain-amino-acid transaminase [Nitrospinota bacterium]
MDNKLIYVNGKLLPRNEAKVSVLDHGFLYGSGVFETMRSYHGKVFMIDKHIERLFRSADAIYLNISMSHEEIREAIEETIKANGLKDAYIRITVSRGEGEPGLDPDLCQSPTVVVYTKEFKPYPEEWYRKGIKIIVTAIKKGSPDYIHRPLKACNYYLPNFFAKVEAKRRGAIEGIMLDEACSEKGKLNGTITEGTVSNIFIISKGVLITPPTGPNVLDGVTREIAIQIAKQSGIPCKEERFSRAELIAADECFLTNTTFEIIPVREVDDFKIGEKSPGDITALLTEKFKRLRDRGI